MAKVDLDVNFPILIIVLSVILISVIEGGRINELVYHKNGEIGRVLFSFIFVVGGMFVIFGMLTVPSAIKEIGYITITIGGGVIFANLLSYLIEGLLDNLAFAEIISGLLIISGGIMLLFANKDEFT